MMSEDIPNCKERYYAGDETLIAEFEKNIVIMIQLLSATSGFEGHCYLPVKVHKNFLEWLWKYRYGLLAAYTKHTRLVPIALDYMYRQCNEYYVTLNYTDTIANRFYTFFRENGISEEVFAPVYEVRNKYVPGYVRVAFAFPGATTGFQCVVPQTFPLFEDLDETFVVIHCSSCLEAEQNQRAVEEKDVQRMNQLFDYPSTERHREHYDNLSYH